MVIMCNRVSIFLILGDVNNKKLFQSADLFAKKLQDNKNTSNEY